MAPVAHSRSVSRGARALARVLIPIALLAPVSLRSQAADDPPPIQREFRGVWVATVENIDWPSRPGLPTCDQQAELITILDRAVALRLNAVVLQVRPAADALYASKLEPWSEYLTGAEGKAPSPWYDPLAFAVREAHARGLELHAWFNPYRAGLSSQKSPHSASHVSRTMPSYVKKYGPYLWMDPGEPAVRQRTLRVVLDVVRRYDIDGVHIDDYFYPYKEFSRGRELDFPDDRSWRKYRRNGGKLSRDDWRRRNVDQLVHELYAGVHDVKPWVKFGVSPFGIWRPRNPPSISGFDAYTQLYADSRKWLREGWVDYFVPQLYWPIAQTAQSYPTLLSWWAGENVKNRHLWPGNYTSKAGAGEAKGWRAQEVLDQVRLTRAQEGATGNVHFSMLAFLVDPDSINERLTSDVYAAPALVPASPWLDHTPPAAPKIRLAGGAPAPAVGAGPGPEEPAPPAELLLERGGKEAAFLWAVRTRADPAAGWSTEIVSGATTRVPLAPGVRDVVVTAVDRSGNESGPARLAVP